MRFRQFGSKDVAFIYEMLIQLIRNLRNAHSTYSTYSYYIEILRKSSEKKLNFDFMLYYFCYYTTMSILFGWSILFIMSGKFQIVGYVKNYAGC